MIARATNENAPLERGGFSATGQRHQNNCGANEATDKAFKQLQKAFTDHGHRLTRTVDCDGTVTLFAGVGLYSRELQDLEAARRFLVQIGGRE